MQSLEEIKAANEQAFREWEKKAKEHGHGPYKVFNECAIPSNARYCTKCGGFFRELPAAAMGVSE